MNTPPYFLVDEMQTVVAKVKTALSLTNLNYMYGYLSEVRETLAKDTKTAEFRAKKYPLIWLVQPFTVTRGTLGIYGILSDVRIFIINGSDQKWTAAQRMENNFKPVIYPIYEELIKQINLHTKFYSVGSQNLSHKTIDRYYWGSEQQNSIDDVFDCMEISGLTIKLKHNPNCLVPALN